MRQGRAITSSCDTIAKKQTSSQIAKMFIGSTRSRQPTDRLHKYARSSMICVSISEAAK